MKRLVLALVFFTSILASPALAQAPSTDTTFYSVSYIEVKPSSRTVAIGTLKQYRDIVRREDNIIRLELFEQSDRPAHFVIVETWRTPAAYDAKAAQRKQPRKVVRFAACDDPPA